MSFRVHGRGADETVVRQGYPLGFQDLDQARDLTREYAELDREGTVFISGSSVTNRSYRGGQPFRQESDWDVGISSDTLNNHRDVGDRGFPDRGTDLNRLERFMGGRSGRSMGLRVYTTPPTDRPYMERPHTPEPQRRTPPTFSELIPDTRRGSGGRGNGNRGRGGGGNSGRGRGGRGGNNRR